jgi:hypothetical protein
MELLRDEVMAAATALDTRPRADGALVAEPLESRPWARLARSNSGYALVLPSTGGPPSPELRLEHLRVRFNVDCEVVGPTSKSEETLTLAECTSDDDRLQRAFLEVVSVLLPAGEVEVASAVARAVNVLADLFQALVRAGRTSTLGLWGELLLMDRSSDPALAAASWHTTPRDRFDFANGDLRVEVKTTVDLRTHHFSLEQLRPPPGLTVFVVSIVTTASAAGPSIEELLASISRRCDGDVRESLLTTAMSSLGSGWPDGSRARFDRTLAEQTLRWFPSVVVPCVADPPPEVSRVQFVSDLQTADWLEEAAVGSWGALAAALACNE